MYLVRSTYLVKLRTGQNESKLPKSNRNDPQKLRSDVKRAKISELKNLEFFTSFRFSNFEPKCPNLGILDQEYQLPNISTNFCLYSISKMLISNMTLVFEKFLPKYPSLSILVKKYWLSKLNENLYVHHFECADFKFDTGFRKI